MSFQTWLLGMICLLLWGGQFQPLRGVAYEAWWVLLALWCTVGLLAVFLGWLWRKVAMRGVPRAPDMRAAIESLRRANVSRDRRADAQAISPPPAEGL